MIFFPNQERFEEFLSNLNESKNLINLRKNNYVKFRESELSFKHGLNISFFPSFDFNNIKISNCPKFIRKIHNPKIINIESFEKPLKLSKLSKKDFENYVKNGGYSKSSIAKDTDIPSVTPLLCQDVEHLDHAQEQQFLTSRENHKSWRKVYDFHYKINNKSIDILEKDKFFYFNQSFSNDSLYLKIKDNLRINEPIIIETSLLNDSLISNIFITLEENSKAEIMFLNKNLDSKQNVYFSQNIYLLADKNSILNLINLQNFNSNIFSINSKILELYENSSIDLFDIFSGSNFTRSEVYSSLKERKSKLNNKLFTISKQNEQFDFSNNVSHDANETFSNISTKAVLYDNSKVLNRGLIKITENAKDSDGFEKHEFLLLDKDAEANAIPKLEINNENVKCSHGTTISNIDYEKLFYLTSRGLSEKKAKEEIIKAFLNIEYIDIDNSVDYVMQNRIIHNIIREEIDYILAKKIKTT